jgi:type II restriction enzyme
VKLGFEESGQAAYDSGAQKARVLTETWAALNAFCPNCSNNRLTKLPNNSPVADFVCTDCSEQYELKSQKNAFGPRIADGAYTTMIQRLSSDTAPNLLLLRYTLTAGVQDLMIIPKHFFAPSIIEKRKPLAPTARRAGWVGCNILLSRVPDDGKIFIVRNQLLQDRATIASQWKRNLFLREASTATRSWLLDVWACVLKIGQREFSLEQMYGFESYLKANWPENENVRPKIRQQLQFLRDRGKIEFLGHGLYRLKD